MKSEREIRNQISLMEEYEHLLKDDVQYLMHSNFKSALKWVIGDD